MKSFEDTIISQGDLEVPQDVIRKWQTRVDLLVDFFDVSYGGILRFNNDKLEVVVANQILDNQFVPGVQFGYDPDQIKYDLLNKDWFRPSKDAVEIIEAECFIGLPICNADKKLFGIICLFDAKEKIHSQKLTGLLSQFHKSIEADLSHLNLEIELENSKSEHQSQKDFLYKILFENSGTINCFFDHELKLRLFNESFRELFSEYIPVLTQGEIIPEYKAYQFQIFERIKLTLKKRKLQKYKSMYNLDGEKLWFDSEYIPVIEEGKLKGVHIISRNITDLIEAEEKIKNTEKVLKDFERIYNLVANPICIADINAVFLKVNPALSNLLGYSVNEIEGRTMFEFIHPEDIQRTIDYIQEKIVEQPDIMRFENRYVRKDGSYVWFSWIVQPIYSEGISYSVAHDITRLKEIEKELIIAREKAEESDRLKTAFLCNMSHEIRTPMNGIIGFSDILKDSDTLNDQLQSYCDIISESGHQLLRIVNDIIDVSKIEIGQIDLYENQTSINELIKGLVTFYTPIAEKNDIDFFTSKPLNDEDSTILCDSTKLRQVLDNLISNAIKFTHNGFIKVTYELLDDLIQFRVEDSGVGISEDQHDTIFDRFIQAENNINQYGGTGLGLAISKAYVEKMGGKIWLESELGIGTKFFFTLPYTK